MRYKPHGKYDDIMNLPEAIQACRDHSPPAQKYLFDRFSEPMYALCYRYVKNHEDAEELMLNGFLSFYRGIRHFQYRGDASVTPWLKKIMINECLMFLRKTKNLHMVSLKEEIEVPVREEALEQLAAADIYQLVLELPPGYRTVFNLYVIEGISHREIGRLLGISEGTSKSQLSKARSMLQTRMNNHETIKQSGHGAGR